jgi:hypothetical protein
MIEIMAHFVKLRANNDSEVVPGGATKKDAAVQSQEPLAGHLYKAPCNMYSL